MSSNNIEPDSAEVDQMPQTPVGNEGQVNDEPVTMPAPAMVERRIAPAVWPSVVVGVGVIPAAMLLSIAVVAVAVVFALIRGEIENPAAAQEWVFDTLLGSPLGLLVLLIPAQLLFLLAAVVPAVLSRESTGTRLALVRGGWSWWMVPIFMGGTIFIMLMSSMMLDRMFDHTSEHLVQLTRLFQEAPLGWFIVATLVISLAPGFAEELVFRGYVQRRLLQRWSPVFAIGLTTVLFAVAHMDVQHSLGVLALGLWLGLIMWRTGSVWPCIICHAFNNFVAVTLARAGDSTVFFDGERGVLITVTLAMLLVGIVLLFLLKPARSE